MAWPVYSTRFLLATLNAAWSWYVVPGGYRAVVKNVLAVNNSTEAGDGLVAIGTELVWIAHFPGAGGSSSTLMHMVLNGGEALGANPGTAGMRIVISGFLLRDDGARAALLPAVPDDIELPAGPELVPTSLKLQEAV